MLPAIWGAMKAADWTQRGITAGVIVGVLSAVFSWGYIKGHSNSTAKHDAAMLDQALSVGKHEAAKAETLAKLEERQDQRERERSEQEKVVTHEVIKYVQVAKPIELEPRYVALLNEHYRMQRDAEDRVSQANATIAEVDELRAYKITTNQLLLAYHELANARGKDLAVIADEKERERARYAAEMEFYNGLPATARANNAAKEDAE